MPSMKQLLKQYTIPLKQPKPILYLDNKVYNLDYDFEIISEEEPVLSINLYNIIGYYIKEVRIEIGGVTLFDGGVVDITQKKDNVTQTLSLKCEIYTTAFTKIKDAKAIAKGDSLNDYIKTNLQHTTAHNIVFAKNDTNTKKLESIALIEGLGCYAITDNFVMFAKGNNTKALPINYILDFQLNYNIEKKDINKQNFPELQIVCLLNPFLAPFQTIEFQGTEYSISKTVVRFSKESGVLQEVYCYDKASAEYLKSVAKSDERSA